MQREEPPVMTTELERIAAKAGCEPKLRFTSLAHHITKERVWMNLCQLGHFEGRKLARLSSPRDPVDRRLWLPGIGAMPFPPSGHSSPLRANNIRFPYPACNAATLPEALPVRTERHNPRSIAPLRRKIDPFRSISASLSLLSSRLLIRQ
jgi:hypothetical protein